MKFMEMNIYGKGELYSADCEKCGTTMYTHEWTTDDHNERRDAMLAGTCRCDECAMGRADPDTFMSLGRQYAGRYSANGYMDCTDWQYSANLRTLKRELRDMYGDN